MMGVPSSRSQILNTYTSKCLYVWLKYQYVIDKEIKHKTQSLKFLKYHYFIYEENNFPSIYIV